MTAVETVPIAIEYNNQKREVYCRGFTLLREMFTIMGGGDGYIVKWEMEQSPERILEPQDRGLYRGAQLAGQGFLAAL